MFNPQQLATIYVLPQEYVTPYPPDLALQYGTVFPNLNQPYKQLNQTSSHTCNQIPKQCSRPKR